LTVADDHVTRVDVVVNPGKLSPLTVDRQTCFPMSSSSQSSKV
jgi:hypothetical protein